jgi:uncharacterized damage-inducible protein DinB
MTDYPRIDVTPYWARVTDQLVEIVGALSEAELDRRPAPRAWCVREHLIHVVASRPGPMDPQMRQLQPALDVDPRGKTREGLQELLRESWARIATFLASPEQLDATYAPPPPDPEQFRHIAEGPPVYPTEPGPDSGHFIAYHRLVHDVHHRACILNVVDQLGLELQGVRRLHPL